MMSILCTVSTLRSWIRLPLGRYTIGGYDGDAGAMTATVEFYETRMPSWVMVEPMN